MEVLLKTYFSFDSKGFFWEDQSSTELTFFEEQYFSVQKYLNIQIINSYYFSCFHSMSKGNRKRNVNQCVESNINVLKEPKIFIKK